MSALPVFIAGNLTATPGKIKSHCVARVYGQKNESAAPIGAALRAR